jgi:hypothetical protein
MLPNKCLHIGGTIDASQVGIKDEFGHARSGLNLDLQNVQLRREQHAELQLRGSYLVGHGMCSLNKHLVSNALCVRGVGGHADGREDVEVVGLWRQERPAVG